MLYCSFFGGCKQGGKGPILTSFAKTPIINSMPSSSLKRGISPIIIIVIVAVLLGGGFLLVRSGRLPVSVPGVSQFAARVTEKDFPNITDPILRKHFVAQTNVNAVRTVTMSSGKGTKDTTEHQIKGNDFRYRMKEEDGSKEISHQIIIGDTTYLKDYSDNKWWKQTAKPEASPTETPETPEDLKEELAMEDPSLYKNLGTEACGSLTCYKYEQTFKDFPGKRTFWFDNKQYLLRKEESGYGEFTTKVEYSYDGISISAPSPTKDVPEGKSIYDYMYSGSQAPSYNVPTSNPQVTLPPDITMPPDITEPPADSGGDTGY